MLYHERECKNEENANFVQRVYLLAKLCNIFDEAFLLTSVYIACFKTSFKRLTLFTAAFI